jgi:hypothetical protein
MLSGCPPPLPRPSQQFVRFPERVEHADSAFTATAGLLFLARPICDYRQRLVGTDKLVGRGCALVAMVGYQVIVDHFRLCRDGLREIALFRQLLRNRLLDRCSKTAHGSIIGFGRQKPIDAVGGNVQKFARLGLLPGQTICGAMSDISIISAEIEQIGLVRLILNDCGQTPVKEYQNEFASRSKDLRRQTAIFERKISGAETKIKRLVEAVAAGGGEFVEIRAALMTAKGALAIAQGQLAETEAMPIVAMHPAIADNYRKQIASLDSTPISPDPSSEAIPAIRSLIDRLVLTPNPLGRGVQIQVKGRLNAITALATGAEARRSMLTVERVKGIEPSS